METIAIGVVVAYLAIKFWKFVFWVVCIGGVLWLSAVTWVMRTYDLWFW